MVCNSEEKFCRYHDHNVYVVQSLDMLLVNLSPGESLNNSLCRFLNQKWESRTIFFKNLSSPPQQTRRYIKIYYKVIYLFVF